MFNISAMSKSGTDVLMPPKKSKAARKTLSQKDEDEEAEDSVAITDGKLDNGETKDGDSEEDGGEGDDRNIFKIDIVEGKRKRSGPAGEHLLQDWLKKNFVEQKDSLLSMQDMYTVYLENCTASLSVAVELPKFVKMQKEFFPNGIALVDDSPYKDTIKVPKQKTKRQVSDSMAKSREQQTKVKEWIREAVLDLGNPRRGLRCNVIANCLMSKYPALRATVDAKRIANWVQREHRFGHIECVRGIGACGLYRLPRTKEEEDLEIAEEERVAKEKLAKKEKDIKKGDSGKEGGDTETKDKSNGKETEEGKDAEKTDDGKVTGENTTQSEEQEDDKSAKTKKKKKKKLRKMSKKKVEKVIYGEPKRIEDTFALAMTYNSEPKEASALKIRRYLQQYYHGDSLNVDKLKKCLESGIERGYWFQVSGQNATTGTFQLAIEQFDPTADDDMTGQVMNAIVACTEPKISSSQLLKKYIIDYHPEFKVTQRPLAFKKALQRAVDKNVIIQLSGIGAAGSFQLASTFTPSPQMLQGSDTASDYDDETSVSDAVTVNTAVAGGRRGEQFAVEMFRDAYVPRPTKRHGRRAATAIERLDPSIPNPRHTQGATGRGRQPQPTSTQRSTKHTKLSRDSSSQRGRPKLAGKRPAKKRKVTDESESEEESETDRVEYTPQKTKSRGDNSVKKPSEALLKRGRPKSAKKAKVTDKSESEEESESETDRVEYTPQKTKSRGGNSVKKPSEAPSKHGRPKSAKKAKVKDESDEEEESESETDQVEYTPQKTKSRGSISVKKPITTSVKHGRPKSAKKAKDESEEEASETDQECNPQKTKSRDGILAVPSAASVKRSRPNSAKLLVKKVQDESEESESEKVEYTPQLSRSRGGILEKTSVATANKRDRGSFSGKKVKQAEKVGSSKSDRQQSKVKQYQVK